MSWGERSKRTWTQWKENDQVDSSTHLPSRLQWQSIKHHPLKLTGRSQVETRKVFGISCVWLVFYNKIWSPTFSVGGFALIALTNWTLQQQPCPHVLTNIRCYHFNIYFLSCGSMLYPIIILIWVTLMKYGWTFS